MSDAMGWQERDWARQPDEDPRAPRRRVIWTVASAIVLVVGGFAYSQRSHQTGPVYGVTPNQPDVIYGQPTDLSGEHGVCTEYEWAGASWRCDVIDLNAAHLRVARAAPYDGPCTHMSVDQASGRWVCISVRPTGAPPAPAGQNS